MSYSYKFYYNKDDYKTKIDAVLNASEPCESSYSCYLNLIDYLIKNSEDEISNKDFKICRD